MSKENPPISIVIPVLNEERYLPVLLESLLKSGRNMDVIVVDGGSSDRTLAAANSFAPRFAAPSSLRALSSPRGLSRQRNLGARTAKHDLVLFLDADTAIPSREAFQQLITSFHRSGFVAGTAHLTPLENIFRAHVIYMLFDWTQRVFLLFGQPYLGTFCLVTKRSVFDAIGGFDETKPVTEDIDFCFKAAALGRVGHLPVWIPVSARRFMQYGYWHVFWIYLKEGFIFVTTGKARLEKIAYPFGEYAPAPAHAEPSDMK